jgi:hypothetical protein
MARDRDYRRRGRPGTSNRAALRCLASASRRPGPSTRPTPSWIGVLHRPRRHRSGARPRLFRGRARSALGGQAANPRRGPAHRRQHRQAAGADTQGLSRCAYVYSITLSARATNIAGTVTPIAFAVLRLITSSNLLACSTGMSATLVPRKSLTIFCANVSSKADWRGP